MPQVLNIADQALRLAQRLAYPNLQIEHYLQTLDQLAARATALTNRPMPSQNIRALNRVLFEEEGFIRNISHEEEIRHCFLNETLDRKTGSPATLALIYLETARRMGLPLQGVDVPGEYWVKWPIDNKVMLIDPAHGGATLSSEILLRRMEHRFGGMFSAASLLKFSLKTLPDEQYNLLLLKELRYIYRSHKHWSKLLRVIDELLVYAPRDAQLWEERSEVHRNLECPKAALRDYQRFLRLAPARQENEQVRYQLDNLEHIVRHLH